MSNITLYLQAASPALPLFHQPFWLDAVAGEGWDVALVKKEEKILASMPYAFGQKRPGLFIRGPHLTQFLGPWFHSPLLQQEEAAEIISQLYAQLPRFAFYNQRWHYSLQQGAASKLQRFKTALRITHILPLQENVQEGFSEKTKREIRKAEKNFQAETVSAAAFYEFAAQHLSQKNFPLHFSSSLFEMLADACGRNNCGKIFAALDEGKKIRAAIFIAWDSTTAYYIMGARDAAGGNDGAMSFLFSTAFQFLKEKVATFDFEGSMIPGIAGYFKSFGAQEKYFSELTAIPSLAVRAGYTLKHLLVPGRLNYR